MVKLINNSKIQILVGAVLLNGIGNVFVRCTVIQRCGQQYYGGASRFIKTGVVRGLNYDDKIERL
jgi:hypothetical protein